MKELSYLIGFANILCVVKQENLDTKLYKDFILDFVTRIVEGKLNNIKSYVLHTLTHFHHKVIHHA